MRVWALEFVSYMNLVLRIPLHASPEQHARLRALQVAFAEVCNVLAPLVQQTRVWNRVALHHLAYRQLREQFPALGSQMVCNAIYSVSRTSRLIYQNPASAFNVSRLQGKPLPLLRFNDSCPVYFDRHTLSLKAGQLSLFTLDGRMRFQLALRPDDEAAFHTAKLREIVLSRRRDGVYELAFCLEPPGGIQPAPLAQKEGEGPQADGGAGGQIPEYVMVEKMI